jgi:isoleucyl-tRNA synthetase
MVPILDENFRRQLSAIEHLVLTEVNVKELQYLTDTSGILVKKIKPNFKELGPRFGKSMKSISAEVAKMNQKDISALERDGVFTLNIPEGPIQIVVKDVDILSEDIPGWLVANEGRFTVALDVTVSEELRNEGIARELINRIQNLRKDAGFDVTDKIRISILKHSAINKAVEIHRDYIASQTLANEILLVDFEPVGSSSNIEIDADIITAIKVDKIGV